MEAGCDWMHMGECFVSGNLFLRVGRPGQQIDLEIFGQLDFRATNASSSFFLSVSRSLYICCPGALFIPLRAQILRAKDIR